MREKIAAVFSEETPKKYSAVFGLILIAVVLCEIFIFNYKWLNSAFDKEVTADNISVINTTMKNGKIIISEDAGKYVTLLIGDVNSEIRYLYFNPDEGNAAKITVIAADEKKRERT